MESEPNEGDMQFIAPAELHVAAPDAPSLKKERCRTRAIARARERETERESEARRNVWRKLERSIEIHRDTCLVPGIKIPLRTMKDKSVCAKREIRKLKGRIIKAARHFAGIKIPARVQRNTRVEKGITMQQLKINSVRRYRAEMNLAKR